jgi:DNA-binding MarR family transcriptional regulator
MDSWGGQGMSKEDLVYGQATGGGAATSLLVLSATGQVPVALSRSAQALDVRCVAATLGAPVPAFGGGHAAIWSILADLPELALLDSLDGALTDGGCGLIFELGAAAIEPVWNRFGDRDGVIMLADPNPHEVHAALASMLAGLTMAVHSPVETMHQQQLERLQEEVNRIARALARMSEPEARLLLRSPDGSREPPSPFIEDQLREARQSFAAGSQLRALGDTPIPAGPPVAAREVRRLIRLRRTRDQFFEPELFADPAWDMLLDLYAARLEHNRVSVSSLCIAAAVPATTALRWIKALTTAGVFERRADPHDGRRIFVALSDSAAAAMHAYFAAIVDEGAVI